MKVLGQDLLVLKNQIEALVLNVLAWAGALLPPWLRRSDAVPLVRRGENACVAVRGPGGLDRLQTMSLHQHEYPYGEMATVGYNVPPHTAPFVKISKPYSNSFAPDLVLISVDYFSVNYADVCIRWGLYESALRCAHAPCLAPPLTPVNVQLLQVRGLAYRAGLRLQRVRAVGGRGHRLRAGRRRLWLLDVRRLLHAAARAG